MEQHWEYAEAVSVSEEMDWYSKGYARSSSLPDLIDLMRGDGWSFIFTCAGNTATGITYTIAIFKRVQERRYDQS